MVSCLQTTIVHLGTRLEFSSPVLREYSTSIESVEGDGVIMFLKEFFPREARRWLEHRMAVLEDMHALVDEAADVADALDEKREEIERDREDEDWYGNSAQSPDSYLYKSD